VIAYSQFQTQKAQWQLVETQKMKVAAELLKNNSTPLPVMRAEFYRRIDKGWDPKDALLFSFDGSITDPFLRLRYKEEYEKEAAEAIKWAKQFQDTGEEKPEK
jgi:hypothetical protein